MLKITVFALAVLGTASFALLNNDGKDAANRRYDYQFSHNAQTDNQEGYFVLQDCDQQDFVIQFQECDVKIFKFTLSGRGDLNQYITKFALEASFDGVKFFPVNGGRAYLGNSDCRSKVTTYFSGGLPLKYLRFKPLEYFGAPSYAVNISYQALDIKDVIPELASEDGKKDHIVLGGDGRAYSSLTLFERVGGFKTVQKIANVIFATLLRSSNFYDKLKIKNANKLLNGLAEFLQVLLGGPAEINGHACATDLNGYNIDEASFEYFVAAVLQAFKTLDACDDSLLRFVSAQINFNKNAILKH